MTDPDLVEVLTDAQRIGLLGPEPVERHVEHARAWARVLEPGHLCDLGSGAGVPGLILALAWPQVEVTLLDSQTRRTAWLRAATARLGLTGRVRVLEGRAEDLAHRPEHRRRFPLVVARGFASPAVTAECAAGLVATGGVVSVSDTPEPDAGRWPEEPLAALGLRRRDRVVQSGAAFVILDAVAAPDPEVPRRGKLLTRRPRW